MRVRLKGVNRVCKRLADGREVVYWYAWKGGPKLKGEPGSPEFIASYQEAYSGKLQPTPGTLQELIRYYQENSEFLDLSERSKSDYRKHIAIIEREFGDFPLAALSDPETRGEFKQWRSNLAKRSKRQADYALTVLARILSVAKDHGKIRVNPIERPGRLYGGSRRDVVWSFEDEELFLSVAPPHLCLPLLLGAWTGQREGDLLRLMWSAYDGKRLRLRQSKTGAYVEPPVVGPLKAALDAEKARKRGVYILLNTKGQPWTEGGFRSSFFKLRDKIGLQGRTFHDLRGTAVTRLAFAQCTVPEIHVYTGLSADDVQQILVKHYLNLDPAIAENASAKLAKLAEARTKAPNRAPN